VEASAYVVHLKSGGGAGAMEERVNGLGRNSIGGRGTSMRSRGKDGKNIPSDPKNSRKR